MILLRFTFLIFIWRVNGYLLPNLGPGNPPKLHSDDSISDRADKVIEFNITQRLDHFYKSDDREWNQRYLENRVNFEEGGPIFLFLGGNKACDAGILQVGHFYDVAKENNGIIYCLEARFYGKSHPTETLKLDDLRYLNTEQNLSDAAYFIRTKKNETEELADSKVIVAGAKISATYATWLGQKYPSLVDGIWSSSAPLLVQHEFLEFRELQGVSIRRWGGDECYSRINEAFTMMKTLVDKDDTARLDEEFNTCTKLKSRDTQETGTFFYRLAGAMDDTVNVENPANRRIEAMCEIIADEQYKDGISAYAAFMRFINSALCFNYTYMPMIEELRYTEWPMDPEMNDRQWLYQLCYEFNWWPTTGGENQPFGQTIPVDYFYTMCVHVFDRSFTLEHMKQLAKWKNDLYSGLEPKVINAFFTNGDMDPYHAVGVQRDINNKSPAYVLDGYPANQDFEKVNAKLDTIEMAIAKQRIRDLVQLWVQE